MDPAIVERGLKGHRKTQNAVADWLAEHGTVPLSPKRDDPDWDVAWRINDVFYVAEVKSITVDNEERQLRLGLGQVLRYRHEVGGNAVAVLIAEREP
ncbi:MAG: hypothetical protein M0T79_02545, partial [Actinomycetota bacterium]|nr:hypothetical protein [Actinomycetota bacterium]